jgi:hypothetical protein
MSIPSKKLLGMCYILCMTRSSVYVASETWGCQEMKDNFTLILAEEKNNLIKNVNETRNHKVHRYFTLEPLTERVL